MTLVSSCPSFESLLAELVVDLPLPWIAQHVIGLSDFLELLLGPRGLVLVRVVLQGQLPVGLLELVVAGALRDAENGVIIFAHCLQLSDVTSLQLNSL